MLKDTLKQWRIKHNKTQEEMAVLLQTNQPYYNRIEAGVMKPGFVMIERIAKLLDVSPEFIRSML